jgi:soluble lytic murein transglycosylase-like protein
MRLRLLGLLLIAAACTWFAAAVAAAGGEQPPAAKPAPKQSRASALRCPLPKQFRRAFERAARDTELPLALLTAVARIESNLRHDSRNPDLSPSNVLAGARYLRLMLERFHSTDLALAAYNAGPTAVARAGGAPSAEVLTYVANVTRLWRRLQGCK